MFITDDGFQLQKYGMWFVVTHNSETTNSIPANNAIIGVNNNSYSNLFLKEENAIKFIELLQNNNSK